MAVTVVLLFLLMVALTSCTGGAIELSQIAFPVNPTVLEACEERLRFDSLSALTAAFGTPAVHTSEGVANRHVAGQLDEHHHVSFAAADAQFLLIGGIPRTFLLLFLQVHSKGQAVGPQAWVGKRFTAVADALGPSDRSEGRRHFYACNETDWLAIKLSDATVVGVEWLLYVD